MINFNPVNHQTVRSIINIDIVIIVIEFNFIIKVFVYVGKLHATLDTVQQIPRKYSCKISLWP